MSFLEQKEAVYYGENSCRWKNISWFLWGAMSLCFISVVIFESYKVGILQCTPSFAFVDIEELVRVEAKTLVQGDAKQINRAAETIKKHLSTLSKEKNIIFLDKRHIFGDFPDQTSVVLEFLKKHRDL